MHIIAEQTVAGKPKQNAETIAIKCRMSVGFGGGIAHLM
jgi:hypothetical protein